MHCPECGAELVQSCCATLYHDCLDCGYSPPNQHPCNTGDPHQPAPDVNEREGGKPLQERIAARGKP